ncbi:MAG: amidohydrolase, partial [Planctomycetaceae bacterium]|nr:amidohydrolase [Planctomycetaceae bacterium]
MTDSDITPAEIVDRCQTIMAHAWMVRTFVKHSDEAEDFPELMHLARAVFDTARALETRVDDPAAYLKMLTKKIGK